LTGLAGKTFEITIEKLIYGGHGLGRHQGKVVFVPFVVPGDRLLVRTIEGKKTFIRAETVKLLDPGPDREQPRCPHFGRCGGCQWQNLEYSRQVETKRKILEELLHHKLPETRDQLIPMSASPKPYEYRSRARLQLRGQGSGARIGFYRYLSHEVEDVEMCPLFTPMLNQALASVRSALCRGKIAPGVLQMAIACSEEEARWEMAAVDAQLDEGASSLADLAEAAPIPLDLHRRIGDFAYAVSPAAFFQANDSMVSELTGSLQELAMDAGRSAVLDLYSGVGLFALPLARHYRRVVAVESSPLAARLCVMNAASAGILNLETHCSDVAAWMRGSGSPAKAGFDLIVLDPPRAGAGPEVMSRIQEWAPEAIIYVSCDPQTLCRDLSAIRPGTYQIDRIQGLDLFPQSYHFETIVRLKRR
jgi:23S rRNA (uracil1939-C5)-methyltransferase